QNNLGNVLTTLGARENSTQRLEEAVAAFGAALLERSLERVPVGWAHTTYNQSLGQRALATSSNGPQRAENFSPARQFAANALAVYRAVNASYHVARTERLLAQIDAELAGSR